MVKDGVGARARRKEDERFLLGRGQYIGDLRLARMRDVAFVRSPVAHAYLKKVNIPPHLRDSVIIAGDLTDMLPMRAVSPLPGFQASEQSPLATDKIRQVGELIAMCVAATRAEAEDIAAQITIEYEELPAVVDMLEALKPGAPLVHDSVAGNLYCSIDYHADIESVAKSAPFKVTREVRTARQVMSPIECRGFITQWDPRLSQLIVHGATQFPHVVRSGLAKHLQIPELQIRVVAPDVGGGFGYKAILAGEELCLSWLAMRVDYPLRWIEDRREMLVANANCREHYYKMTAYTDEKGKILAFEADGAVDSGAYSSYPFTSAVEAAQAATILPGPYDIPVYRCAIAAVATNKAPQLPYRGVARPGVCYAMEVMIDAVAREVGREPHEVRAVNLVKPEQMPYSNITDKVFDSGDYPQLLKMAMDEIDFDGVRQRQKEKRADGRLVGVGMSIFSEQTGHAMTQEGKVRVLHEQAFARITPDGRLEIRCGIHSIGQGLETTLAQIGAECLTIDFADIQVKLGDTEISPYSSGAWGSRGMIWAGGATARACKELAERVKKIGASMLQTDIDSVTLHDGMVSASGGHISIREIASAYYLWPENLPKDTDAHGLEVTGGFAPTKLTGMHSGSAHVVVVAVDIETGSVEILDYAISEDAGTLVNPMIVEGQIYGGAAQGIGTALFEEMPFDRQGQPLASTLADYLLPGCPDVPNIKILHMETPSPHTEFGIKGVGEGGAIGSAGAIANAVNDALKGLGVEILQTPITPRRVVEAINKKAGGSRAVAL
ncbi:xanthine dehydrogenase family protein molybdopterin-binding subunit [Mesorhizobium sp. M7A.F.Ca.US.006.01.1.1]|uniref:xanthine dehydrogenase family protein molybdopterin-binding subunit n=1 Tax=Mesorhizobium sp. M7A.F.Ca.US.006.01.1.1 TaxID=2496707 RepID=UPI000FCB407D|nr:xanthine dehydrogenase family protein molybdopterin-binding subunit [Mesorhizobium sp. M7A.F.Ca.US.006.01.1.1]RUZ73357.1 xanthine dehydrogenase family protein molybdopterin-binding subunit [Mesorhizobium sp. M7A.F.Ca.US.006.01.1.1]